MIEPKGYMVEIFKGIQGEGPRIGESQIFLRFAGCNLSCKHCDTGYALTVPPEYKTSDGGSPSDNEYHDNPLTLIEAMDIVRAYGTTSTTISITGGEPLLQVEYLKMLLPLLKREGRRIYLETNATLPKQLAEILKWVDIVSSDIKLPSFTGEDDIPREHQEFLHIAKGKDLFVKVVVTDETVIDEISLAVDIIKGVDTNIPLIIQPVKAMKDQKKLLGFHDYADRKLTNVRLIPQVHKLMGWR